MCCLYVDKEQSCRGDSFVLIGLQRRKLQHLHHKHIHQHMPDLHFQAVNREAVNKWRSRPGQVSVCLKLWEPTPESGELVQI